MRSLLLLALINLISPILLAQDNVSEPTSVIAEGSGVDAKSALDDAFRQAVQQVVGLMVDAETLVENDKLVREKVLTYSGGFIVNYKTLAEVNNGSIARIRIQANVARQALRQRLEASQVIGKNVDGPGIFAEATTKMQSNASFGEMIDSFIGDLSTTVLTVKHPDRPRIVSLQDDTANIVLDVSVSVDEDRYRQVAEKLTDLLSKHASKTSDFVVRSEKQANGKLYIADGVGDTIIRDAFVEEELRPDVYVIAVGYSLSKSGDRMSNRYYFVDPAALQRIIQATRKQCWLSVRLLDEDGKEVSFDKFEPKLEGDHYQSYDTNLCAYFTTLNDEWRTSDPVWGEESQMAWIMPVFSHFSGEDLYFLKEMPFQVKFSLSLEELKSVKSIQCQFTN